MSNGLKSFGGRPAADTAEQTETGAAVAPELTVLLLEKIASPAAAVHMEEAREAWARSQAIAYAVWQLPPESGEVFSHLGSVLCTELDGLKSRLDLIEAAFAAGGAA